MNMEKDLERFRFGIYMGYISENITPLTQEEYVDHYEQLVERNPAQERRLMKELSEPLLPLYRTQMEQVAKMEQMISGTEEEVFFTDDEVLHELYDEISNLETEQEWQEFKKRILKNT